MSYYHTYRPQQFGDLIGQEHIRTILQEAIRSRRLAHAYLFSGSRGTGKTTTARILAKAINCQNLKNDIEPCGNCALCKAIVNANCLDVIEIDAASNRGIDEIRELQEQLRFRPQVASRKVFIIDEVHMLTKEAFNALLKTLEEPPDYLILILATTEPHKLPATVISRCQRFDFLTPTKDVINQYLKKIAQSEKLEVDPEALDQLAELAGGSFRDATTLLEQLSGEPISLKRVRTVLGLPEEALVQRYLAGLAGGPDHKLVSDMQSYFERGGNPGAFLDRAFRLLEDLIKEAKLIGDARAVLHKLVLARYQMKYTPSGSLPILTAINDNHSVITYAKVEVSAVKKTDTKAELTDSQTIDRATQPTKEPVNKISDFSLLDKISDVEKADTVPIDEQPPAVKESDTVAVEVAEQVPPAELPSGELAEYWQKVIQKLIENNQTSLLAILRTAKPVNWEPPILSLAVQFKFHADQLSRQKNRAILESLLGEAFGCQVQIQTEVQPIGDLASVAEEIFSS